MFCARLKRVATIVATRVVPRNLYFRPELDLFPVRDFFIFPGGNDHGKGVWRKEN
jgi:hypothetical protein